MVTRPPTVAGRFDDMSQNNFSVKVLYFLKSFKGCLFVIARILILFLYKDRRSGKIRILQRIFLILRP
jgi:hypothetical protein